MDLSIIKQELSTIGYQCFIKDNILIVGTSKQYHEDLGFYSVQNTVGIEIKKGKIVVDYTPAQIPKEKEFSNIEEAVNFIKIVRPLS
jgi:hypothetical protein